VALVFPAVEIVKGLQVGDVGLKLATRELVINPSVVVLAEVDQDPDVHAREPSLKRQLGRRLRIREIAAGIDNHLATFGHCSLVELVERPRFHLWGDWRLRRSSCARPAARRLGESVARRLDG
jgi:hypothetical protein